MIDSMLFVFREYVVDSNEVRVYAVDWAGTDKDLVSFRDE